MAVDGARPSGPTAVSAEKRDVIIGRYRLLKELGKGGFGIVWQAEQTELIRREVALKIIKPGMDSSEIIARFEAERQTLALMEHPNIAGVLDAGTTDLGRPYFVMELVKGVPITEYCDAHKLGICERLELFIPVCQAVQHAHQKAILHRDLKPSNILVAEVDGKPVPKVIDFGIAKALGATQEEVLVSLAHTQQGMVIGTPQYMSPEQAGSMPDVDTRSDIYTLGVILHELLTGQTPLSREELRAAAFDEMLRLIREGEIKRPSSRLVPVTKAIDVVAGERNTESKKLGNALRGDLDWILLKTLEKDRNRRYETATAFAQDLRSYLNHEPVSVGPPSAGYRLRKLVRRNRLAFAAAAAVFVSLAAGITVSTWQAVRATHAESLAKTRLQEVAAQKKRAEEGETAAQQAKEKAVAAKKSALDLLEYMEGSLSQTLEKVGRLDLMDSINKRIRKYHVEHPSEAGDTLSLNLEIEAIYDQGNLSVLEGRLKDALEQYSNALKIAQKIAALKPDDVDSQRPLSVSFNKIGDVLRTQGDLPGAMKYYRDGFAIAEKIVGKYPDDDSYLRDLGVSYYKIGLVQDDQGDHSGALKSFTELLAINERRLKKVPGDSERQHDVFIAYSMVGQPRQYLGDLSGALESYGNALTIIEKLLKQEPENTLWLRDLFCCYASIGSVQFEQRDLSAALKSYRDGLAVSEKLVKMDRRNAIWQHDLSDVYGYIGEVLQAQGDLSTALKSYRDSFVTAEKLVKQDPGNTGWQCDLSIAYEGVGEVLQAQGDLPNALKNCSEGLSLIEKLANHDAGNAEWQGRLATAYWHTGATWIKVEPKSKNEARAMMEKGGDVLRLSLIHI